VAGWLSAVFGMEMPESLPNARRWLDRVQARPSWNA
jgi:glutathione S-transferase